VTAAAFWHILLLALDKHSTSAETLQMSNQAAHIVRERVRQWAEAEAVMQEVRDEDIRNADTARAMRCFSGAVEALLHDHPPEPWSGLVTQQRWFTKLRTA
jgi:hypothetical protein